MSTGTKGRKSKKPLTEIARLQELQAIMLGGDTVEQSKLIQKYGRGDLNRALAALDAQMNVWKTRATQGSKNRQSISRGRQNEKRAQLMEKMDDDANKATKEAGQRQTASMIAAGAGMAGGALLAPAMFGGAAAAPAAAAGSGGVGTAGIGATGLGVTGGSTAGLGAAAALAAGSWAAMSPQTQLYLRMMTAGMGGQMGGALGGAFAEGGNPQPNTTNVVGEKGPELFTGGGKQNMVGEEGPELFSPAMEGTIIPNNQLPEGMQGGQGPQDASTGSESNTGQSGGSQDVLNALAMAMVMPALQVMGAGRAEGGPVGTSEKDLVTQRRGDNAQPQVPGPADTAWFGQQGLPDVSWLSGLKPGTVFEAEPLRQQIDVPEGYDMPAGMQTVYPTGTMTATGGPAWGYTDRGGYTYEGKPGYQEYILPGQNLNVPPAPSAMDTLLAQNTANLAESQSTARQNEAARQAEIVSRGTPLPNTQGAQGYNWLQMANRDATSGRPADAPQLQQPAQAAPQMPTQPWWAPYMAQNQGNNAQQSSQKQGNNMAQNNNQPSTGGQNFSDVGGNAPGQTPGGGGGMDFSGWQAYQAALGQQPNQPTSQPGMAGSMQFTPPTAEGGPMQWNVQMPQMQQPQSLPQTLAAQNPMAMAQIDAMRNLGFQQPTFGYNPEAVNNEFMQTYYNPAMSAFQTEAMPALQEQFIKRGAALGNQLPKEAMYQNRLLAQQLEGQRGAMQTQARQMAQGARESAAGRSQEATMGLGSMLAGMTTLPAQLQQSAAQTYATQMAPQIQMAMLPWQMGNEQLSRAANLAGMIPAAGGSQTQQAKYQAAIQKMLAPYYS